ncbi:MAG: glycosyltransferase family 2 protein [Dorea sp.]|jgi:glycosyltransferase involved in cell wall biosynthesis|nr:glycosyltransferase family 2 protein [Dorea sp.]
MVLESQQLISIIVPIYMIDRYLGSCIESILNQTYQNIEIILVDDGSKDRCPELCDLYANKDNRIKVIHKPNGGLVSARKAGLQQSNGMYISYVDGDDWIEPEFVESLYTAAVMSGADVVCAGFSRDLFSRSMHFTDNISAGIYEGKRLKRLWETMISSGDFYQPGITTYVWNKLFRREILLEPQSLADDRISIGEDAAVTYPALYKSKRVAVTDHVFYHYRQREDSMLKQNSGYVQDAEKIKWLYKYLVKWAKMTDPAHRIQSQILDYILANAVMRSGGRLPQNNYSIFGRKYYGKNIVVHGAGTFGQQLVNRLEEAKNCNLVAWLDDDFWEYRRCCLNVDPIETVKHIMFDYLLIAKTDRASIGRITDELLNYGISKEKILTVKVTDDRESLIGQFLDIAALKSSEIKTAQEGFSHA